MLEQILIQLADGKFHSGEDLGEALGINRGVVWKELQRLEELGVDFSSVRGRGYRLHDPVELLSSEQIQASLNEPLDKFEVLFNVDSTNRYLFDLAQDYMGQQYAVFSEMQTAGKGRRGRHWVSPFGKNVYLSVLTTIKSDITQLGGFSLMMALAVEKALENLGVEGVSLKWPNDVYLHGQKLAGILLEMTGEYASHCQLIIGIGLNFDMAETRKDIDQSWTALKHYYPELSRNQVAIELLNSVLLMIKEFKQSGFAPWIDTWNEKDVFYSRQVQILNPRHSIIGVSKGVNERGELNVQTDVGIQVISGGEVSLRAAD